MFQGRAIVSVSALPIAVVDWSSCTNAWLCNFRLLHILNGCGRAGPCRSCILVLERVRQQRAEMQLCKSGSPGHFHQWPHVSVPEMRTYPGWLVKPEPNTRQTQAEHSTSCLCIMPLFLLDKTEAEMCRMLGRRPDFRTLVAGHPFKAKPGALQQAPTKQVIEHFRHVLGNLQVLCHNIVIIKCRQFGRWRHFWTGLEIFVARGQHLATCKYGNAGSCDAYTKTELSENGSLGMRLLAIHILGNCVQAFQGGGWTLCDLLCWSAQLCAAIAFRS